MSTAFPTKQLWWKSARQLLPLVLAVPSLLLVFVLVRTWSYSAMNPQWLAATLAAAPILFAIGVGTVLVGNERESRSLGWLISLPVEPKRLVRHQFSAGLAGLLLLWAIAFALFFVMVQFGYRPAFPDAVPKLGIIYALNSVYLLVCGFAMAWMSRTPFAGLLAILPLAIVPWFANYGLLSAYRSMTGTSPYGLDPPPAMIIASLILCIAGVGWFGYRTALRQVSGAVTRSRSTTSPLSKASSWADSLTQWLRGDSQQWQLAPTSSGSLVWQFSHQNRLVIVGLYAGMLIGGVALAILFQLSNRLTNNAGPFVAIAAVIFYVTLSWMALLVFQGDRVDQQVRFLAERGVSPTRVWIMRHLIPLRFASLCIALFWLDLTLAPEVQSVLIWTAGTFFGPAMLVLAVYSISQWVGCVVKPLVLSALIAPLLSLAWIGWTIQWIYYDYWSFVVGWSLLIVVPMLATWVTMRRWMDGRSGWRFWLLHAGLALVTFAMPSVTYFVNQLRPQAYYLSIISRETQAEARELKRNASPALAIELADWYEEIAPGKSEMMSFEKFERTNREALTGWVSEPNVALTISDVTLSELTGFLATIRMQFDADQSEDRDEMLSRYRQWMGLCQRMVVGLRRSLDLFSQEQADRLEIWLLAELEFPKTVDRLDNETMNRIVRQVSDSDGRWDARRRALLVSYFNHNSGASSDRLVSPDPFGRKVLLDQLYTPIEAAQVVRALLTYIDEVRAGGGTYPIEVLTDAWRYDDVLYGVGPAGAYFRMDDIRKATPPLLSSSRRPPATQWGAGWEETGRQWATRLEQR